MKFIGSQEVPPRTKVLSAGSEFPGPDCVHTAHCTRSKRA